MTFSLTILGSNSAIPTLDRNPSAHLLNVNERFFLIDCAEGTQLQMRKYHLKFTKINHIFISHLHGDHYFGLVGLLTSMHLLGRTDEMHVYGFPELEQIINIQLEAARMSLIYPLIFHPLKDDEMHLIHTGRNLEVFSFPLKHSIPTCGFLFKASQPNRQPPKHYTYAYCSDTIYLEEVIPVIKEVDLLYYETTFASDRAEMASQKFHATSLDAANIAKQANVKKLLIGHFSARYDDATPLLEEAGTIFPETIAASDGMTVTCDGRGGVNSEMVKW